jgi:hypothetical protein
MQTVVLILVGTSAVTIAWVGLQLGLLAILTRIPRFVLTCVLAYYLYRGSLPARFLTVVLLGWAVGRILVEGDWRQPMPAALACFYGYVIGMLLISGDVRAFLAAQRARDSAREPAQPTGVPKL